MNRSDTTFLAISNSIFENKSKYKERESTSVG
jgi:hypothetical protein